MIHMVITATNTNLPEDGIITMRMARTVGIIPTLTIPTGHNTIVTLDMAITTAHMIRTLLMIHIVQPSSHGGVGATTTMTHTEITATSTTHTRN